MVCHPLALGREPGGMVPCPLTLAGNLVGWCPVPLPWAGSFAGGAASVCHARSLLEKALCATRLSQENRAGNTGLAP